MKKLTTSKVLIYVLVSLFTLVSFLPMLLTLAVSFTDEDTIRTNGYQFIPAKLSTFAYSLIFHGQIGGAQASVLNSYFISMIVTVFGTVVAVLITAMAAYTLANKRVKYRNALAFYFFLSMLFWAGIVPWYMLNAMLGLKNNIFALIIPTLLFNAFNMFLVRNFMDTVPDSLRESATIDGANDLFICFKIYFPLCVPVLATISLFYGLSYWNDWWNAIMLIDNKNLYPLQYLLFQLNSQVRMIQQMQSITGASTYHTPPTESLKMATAVITIGPIVLLYPFLQKYFVKGLVIGAVKG